MPHLTVRLYDNELARVKAAAVLRKVPVSELVRDALEAKAAAVLDGAAKPKAAPAPAPGPPPVRWRCDACKAEVVPGASWCGGCGRDLVAPACGNRALVKRAT